MDEQPTDGTWTAPTGPPSAPPPPGYVSGADDGAPEPPGRPSPNRFVLAAAIVAVVAALGFAVFNFAGSGGSSSPEDAVDDLFTAIDNEDVIGVMAALPPSEREVLQPGIEDLSAELQRLQIFSEFDLDAVPGFDLEIDDYQLESRELAEGISVVTVDDGTFFAKTVPDDFPIGDSLRTILEDDFDEDLDDIEPTASADTFGDFELVAVDEDGWHVSIGYSIAEASRGDDTPPPTFGAGPTPVGAESPEGAVEAMVEAGTSLDAEAAITLLDPREMGALYDYAPLFLDEADEAADDNEVEFAVDDLELEATGEGDTRRVVIEGFTASYDDEYESGEFTYDGECYSWDITYEEESFDEYEYDSYEEDFEQIVDEGDTGEVCEGEEPELDDEVFFGGEPFPTFPATTTLAVTVVERDGQWFVSPVRTVLDTVVEGLQQLEPGDIEDFGEWLSEFFGTSYDEDYDYDEDVDDVGEAVPMPGDECYDVFDQYYDDDSLPYERAEYFGERDFRACLDELLAAGEIDDVDDFSPYDDECWATYDALPPEATEEQWAAADAEVRTCQEGNFEGLPEDALPEGVDPAFLEGIQQCVTPEVMGDEAANYDGDLGEITALTPGLRDGFIALRDCLTDLNPDMACVGDLASLSATLPEDDYLAVLADFGVCVEDQLGP